MRTSTTVAGATPGNHRRDASATSVPGLLGARIESMPAAIVSTVATDPVAIAGTNSFVWLGMTNVPRLWTNWPPPHWQIFTNWGPKNALFTVRRFGDASDAITVNYQIGGTARQRR